MNHRQIQKDFLLCSENEEHSNQKTSFQEDKRDSYNYSVVDWKRRHTFFIKSISILLTLIFLHQQAGWAQEGKPVWASARYANKIDSKPQFPNKDFKVPYDVAQTKEAAINGGDEVIIQIQDAHASLSAQYSIAKLLDSLVTNYDLNFIALEGSSGYIDTSLLKTFPDKEIRKDTAEFLMREGRMSAGEFFSITCDDKDIALYGIEDNELYQKNIESFRKVAKDRARKTEHIINLLSQLENLEEKIYSKNLLTFTKGCVCHRQGMISFSDHWKNIEEFRQIQGLDISSYKEISKLRESIDLEKKIDFKKANIERRLLIDELSRIMERPDLEELVLKSLAFKQTKISQADFHKYLINLAEEYKVSSDQYEDLITFARYVAIYESVELMDLYREMEDVENQIRKKLYRNNDEREIFKISRTARLLKQLYAMELNNNEFECLEKDCKDFTAKDCALFIKEKCAKYNVVVSGGYDLPEITGGIDEGMSFYRDAEVRNNAMLINTIKDMRKEGKQVAALITGGYHTQGLTALMKEKKLSYLVVVPKFQTDKERPYIAILTNKKKEYEKILDTGRYQLAVSAYFNDYDLDSVRPALFHALGEAQLQEKNIDEIKANWLKLYTFVYQENIKAGRIKGEGAALSPDEFKAFLDTVHTEKIASTAVIAENTKEGIRFISLTTMNGEQYDLNPASRSQREVFLARMVKKEETKKAKTTESRDFTKTLETLQQEVAGLKGVKEEVHELKEKLKTVSTDLQKFMQTQAQKEEALIWRLTEDEYLVAQVSAAFNTEKYQGVINANNIREVLRDATIGDKKTMFLLPPKAQWKQHEGLVPALGKFIAKVEEKQRMELVNTVLLTDQHVCGNKIAPIAARIELIADQLDSMTEEGLSENLEKIIQSTDTIKTQYEKIDHMVQSSNVKIEKYIDESDLKVVSMDENAPLLFMTAEDRKVFNEIWEKQFSLTMFMLKMIKQAGQAMQSQGLGNVKIAAIAYDMQEELLSFWKSHHEVKAALIGANISSEEKSKRFFETAGEFYEKLWEFRLGANGGLIRSVADILKERDKGELNKENVYDVLQELSAKETDLKDFPLAWQNDPAMKESVTAFIRAVTERQKHDVIELFLVSRGDLINNKILAVTARAYFAAKSFADNKPFTEMGRTNTRTVLDELLARMQNLQEVFSRERIKQDEPLELTTGKFHQISISSSPEEGVILSDELRGILNDMWSKENALLIRWYDLANEALKDAIAGKVVTQEQSQVLESLETAYKNYNSKMVVLNNDKLSTARERILKFNEITQELDKALTVIEKPGQVFETVEQEITLTQQEILKAFLLSGGDFVNNQMVGVLSDIQLILFENKKRTTEAGKRDLIKTIEGASDELLRGIQQFDKRLREGKIRVWQDSREKHYFLNFREAPKQSRPLSGANVHLLKDLWEQEYSLLVKLIDIISHNVQLIENNEDSFFAISENLKSGWGYTQYSRQLRNIVGNEKTTNKQEKFENATSNFRLELKRAETITRLISDNNLLRETLAFLSKKDKGELSVSNVSAVLAGLEKYSLYLFADWQKNKELQAFVENFILRVNELQDIEIIDMVLTTHLDKLHNNIVPACENIKLFLKHGDAQFLDDSKGRCKNTRVVLNKINTILVQGKVQRKKYIEKGNILTRYRIDEDAKPGQGIELPERHKKLLMDMWLQESIVISQMTFLLENMISLGFGKIQMSEVENLSRTYTAYYEKLEAISIDKSLGVERRLKDFNLAVNRFYEKIQLRGEAVRNIQKHFGEQLDKSFYPATWVNTIKTDGQIELGLSGILLLKGQNEVFKAIRAQDEDAKTVEAINYYLVYISALRKLCNDFLAGTQMSDKQGNVLKECIARDVYKKLVAQPWSLRTKDQFEQAGKFSYGILAQMPSLGLKTVLALVLEEKEMKTIDKYLLKINEVNALYAGLALKGEAELQENGLIQKDILISEFGVPINFSGADLLACRTPEQVIKLGKFAETILFQIENAKKAAFQLDRGPTGKILASTDLPGVTVIVKEKGEERKVLPQDEGKEKLSFREWFGNKEMGLRSKIDDFGGKPEGKIKPGDIFSPIMAFLWAGLMVNLLCYHPKILIPMVLSAGVIGTFLLGMRLFKGSKSFEKISFFKKIIHQKASYYIGIMLITFFISAFALSSFMPARPMKEPEPQKIEMPAEPSPQDIRALETIKQAKARLAQLSKSKDPEQKLKAHKDMLNNAFDEYFAEQRLKPYFCNQEEVEGQDVLILKAYYESTYLRGWALEDSKGDGTFGMPQLRIDRLNDIVDEWWETVKQNNVQLPAYIASKTMTDENGNIVPVDELQKVLMYIKVRCGEVYTDIEEKDSPVVLVEAGKFGVFIKGNRYRGRVCTDPRGPKIPVLKGFRVLTQVQLFLHEYEHSLHIPKNLIGAYIQSLSKIQEFGSLLGMTIPTYEQPPVEQEYQFVLKDLFIQMDKGQLYSRDMSAVYATTVWRDILEGVGAWAGLFLVLFGSLFIVCKRFRDFVKEKMGWGKEAEKRKIYYKEEPKGTFPLIVIAVSIVPIILFSTIFKNAFGMYGTLAVMNLTALSYFIYKYGILHSILRTPKNTHDFTGEEEEDRLKARCEEIIGDGYTVNVISDTKWDKTKNPYAYTENDMIYVAERTAKAHQLALTFVLMHEKGEYDLIRGSPRVFRSRISPLSYFSREAKANILETIFTIRLLLIPVKSFLKKLFRLPGYKRVKRPKLQKQETEQVPEEEIEPTETDNLFLEHLSHDTYRKGQIKAIHAMKEGKFVEFRTGGGKTVALGGAALSQYKEKRNRTLIFTHSDDLTRQAMIDDNMGKTLSLCGAPTGFIVPDDDDKEKEKGILYVNGQKIEVSVETLYESAVIIYAKWERVVHRSMRERIGQAPKALRNHKYFTLFDEADLMLVFGSATPCVISGDHFEDNGQRQIIRRYINSFVAKEIKNNKSLWLSRKENKEVFLTGKGEKFVRKRLSELSKQRPKLADIIRINGELFVIDSLKAHLFYEDGTDYYKENNKIFVRDAHLQEPKTGMSFGEGLQQAIEMMAGVDDENITPETYTLMSATITQFLKDEDLVVGFAGASGTMEKERFKGIFPKKEIKETKGETQTLIKEWYSGFKNRDKKIEVLLSKAKDKIDKKQPVLIKVDSDNEAPELKKELEKYFSEKKRDNIIINIANGKNKKTFVKAIEQAGYSNVITIATNIAHRGIDIKITGCPLVRDEQGDFVEGDPICEEKEDAPGLHVISAYLDESKAFEIQTMGRGDRGANQGSWECLFSLDEKIFKDHAKILKDHIPLLKEAVLKSDTERVKGLIKEIRKLIVIEQNRNDKDSRDYEDIVFDYQDKLLKIKDFTELSEADNKDFLEDIGAYEVLKINLFDQLKRNETLSQSNFDKKKEQLKDLGRFIHFLTTFDAYVPLIADLKPGEDLVAKINAIRLQINLALDKELRLFQTGQQVSRKRLNYFASAESIGLRGAQGQFNEYFTRTTFLSRNFDAKEKNIKNFICTITAGGMDEAISDVRKISQKKDYNIKTAISIFMVIVGALFLGVCGISWLTTYFLNPIMGLLQAPSVVSWTGITTAILLIPTVFLNQLFSKKIQTLDKSAEEVMGFTTNAIREGSFIKAFAKWLGIMALQLLATPGMWAGGGALVMAIANMKIVIGTFAIPALPIALASIIGALTANFILILMFRSQLDKVADVRPTPFQRGVQYFARMMVFTIGALFIRNLSGSIVPFVIGLVGLLGIWLGSMITAGRIESDYSRKNNWIIPGMIAGLFAAGGLLGIASLLGTLAVVESNMIFMKGIIAVIGIGTLLMQFIRARKIGRFASYEGQNAWRAGFESIIPNFRDTVMYSAAVIGILMSLSWEWSVLFVSLAGLANWYIHKKSVEIEKVLGRSVSETLTESMGGMIMVVAGATPMVAYPSYYHKNLKTTVEKMQKTIEEGSPEIAKMYPDNKALQEMFNNMIKENAEKRLKQAQAHIDSFTSDQFSGLRRLEYNINNVFSLLTKEKLLPSVNAAMIKASSLSAIKGESVGAIAQKDPVGAVSRRRTASSVIARSEATRQSQKISDIFAARKTKDREDEKKKDQKPTTKKQAKDLFEKGGAGGLGDGGGAVGADPGGGTPPPPPEKKIQTITDRLANFAMGTLNWIMSVRSSSEAAFLELEETIPLTGWEPEPWFDSQGVIDVFDENDMLKIEVDLEGQHDNKSKGEIYFDFIEILGKLKDLTNKKIILKIKVPLAFAWNQENGIEVFAKDENWNAQYSCRTKITQSGEWIQIEYTPVSYGLATVKEYKSKTEWTNEGFDPSKIRRIGIKFVIDEKSTDTVTTYNQDKSIKDGYIEAKDIKIVPCTEIIPGAEWQDVYSEEPITVTPVDAVTFIGNSGAAFYLWQYER
ncbi:MAG: hypothetical protein ABH869_04200, partial [Candidatus Omnitrophota bacterium]